MKIYVGGLTDDLAEITDSDIRSIFHPFGDIDQIDLPKDPITSKSRGFCFVTYKKMSQARAAINAMNGFYYKGKILKVEFYSYLCLFITRSEFLQTI
jgi:RNA-binding protein 39